MVSSVKRIFEKNIPLNIDKKRDFIFLRWALILATTSLIIFDENRLTTSITVQLVVCFLMLSNIIVGRLPKSYFDDHSKERVIIVSDVLLITASCLIAGKVGADFFIVFFLVLLIAGLSESLALLGILSLAVAVAYILINFKTGAISNIVSSETLMKIPFFTFVAVFFGYYTTQINKRNKENEILKDTIDVAEILSNGTQQISLTLDRDQIFENLVSCSKELLDADFSIIKSRSEDSIVYPRSINLETKVKIEEALLKTELLYKVPLFDSDFAENQLILINPKRSSHQKYLTPLLEAAKLALKNSSNYEMLVHESEKRGYLVKDLTNVIEFKTKFFSSLSHELRTPMYSVLGSSELLLNSAYGELSSEQKDIVGNIYTNGKSLLQLINQLLELSKLDSNKYERDDQPNSLMDFAKSIEHTVRPLIRDHSISLKFYTDPVDKLLVTDWGVVRQIALNLVSNAIKFTLKGDVTVNFLFNPVLKNLCLIVEDTGSGIAEEDLNEIFLPYKQAKNNRSQTVKGFAGTGLGLTITKSQVELLGGGISVESEVGAGSRFVVQIPVEQSDMIEEEVEISIGNFNLDV